MLQRARSLQGRLLLLVLALVSTVWVATAVTTWIDTRHELDELLDSHLAQAAAMVVAQQSRAFGSDEHEDDQRLDAPELHPYAPKVAFQVFHEGRLVMRSANAPGTPMLSGASETMTGYRSVTLDGLAWRVFAARGRESDVQVFVGEQEASRAAILWAVMRSTLLPTVLALPLLALAIWWAVFRSVAPLRQIGRTLAQRPPNDLSPLHLDAGMAELAPMLDALNGLLGRIDGLIAAEQRFTADAAHELRTPIAAIQAQAQVALAETDDAARRHALKATLLGCDRASRLVGQLLTLSRVEAGEQVAVAPVELGALVRGVLAEAAPQAMAMHQDLELRTAEPVIVQADATLLAVLARNLVDNAIRYSPAQARILVTVVKSGAGRVQLIVEDAGPGMSDADCQRLGQRFFRVLGTAQQGSGLGWSIVQRIAQTQGARVTVGRSTGLGGLAVTVDWAMSAAMS
jgi:two-component system sensor histidine kinase QseC